VRLTGQSEEGTYIDHLHNLRSIPIASPLVITVVTKIVRSWSCEAWYTGEYVIYPWYKTYPPDRNRAGDLEICGELYSLTLCQLSYGWVPVSLLIIHYHNYIFLANSRADLRLAGKRYRSSFPDSW
jgi:hypothetical protein